MTETANAANGTEMTLWHKKTVYDNYEWES